MAEDSLPHRLCHLHIPGLISQRTNLRHRTPHFPRHLLVSPAAPQVWPGTASVNIPLYKTSPCWWWGEQSPPSLRTEPGPVPRAHAGELGPKQISSVLIRPNGGKRLIEYFGFVVRSRAGNTNDPSGGKWIYALNYMYSSWALYFVAREHPIEKAQTPLQCLVKGKIISRSIQLSLYSSVQPHIVNHYDATTFLTVFIEQDQRLPLIKRSWIRAPWTDS